VAVVLLLAQPVVAKAATEQRAVAPTTVQRKPTAVVVVDPASAELRYDVSQVDLGVESGGVTVSNGVIWSTPHLTAVAQRISPGGTTPDLTIPLRAYAIGEVADGESFWLVTQLETDLMFHVARHDAITGERLAEVDIEDFFWDMEPGHGGIWLGTESGTLIRVDSRTNQVVATIPMSKKECDACSRPVEVAVTDSFVWAFSDGKLARVDPRDNSVADRSSLLQRHKDATNIAGIGDDLVLASPDEYAIVNPKRGRLVGRIRAPEGRVFWDWMPIRSDADPTRFWTALVPRGPDGRPAEPARGQPNPEVDVVLVDIDGPTVVGSIRTPFPERMAAVGEDLWYSILREPRVMHATPSRPGAPR